MAERSRPPEEVLRQRARELPHVGDVEILDEVAVSALLEYLKVNQPAITEHIHTQIDAIVEHMHTALPQTEDGRFLLSAQNLRGVIVNSANAGAAQVLNDLGEANKNIHELAELLDGDDFNAA